MADEVLDRPEVDELYAAEPSDFVTARAAAVKALKAAGDKDAAAVVAKLKKPTRVAWAINQVARRAGDRIGELRAAGADLRERQAEALAGGSADALREATVARRDLVRSLTAEVTALVGDAHREEAGATFEVASIDDEIGEQLTAGRLATAIARTADLGFFGMPEPTAPPAARRERAPKRSGARTAADAAGADEPPEEPPAPPRLDRRRIAKLERTLTGAEDAVAGAEKDATRSDTRRKKAEAALDEARLRLKDAETEADAASSALVAARTAAELARTELDEARSH